MNNFENCHCLNPFSENVKQKLFFFRDRQTSSMKRMHENFNVLSHSRSDISGNTEIKDYRKQ